jgi:hypothetical protein
MKAEIHKYCVVPSVWLWHQVQQSLAACNHLAGGLGPHFNYFQGEKLTEVRVTTIWKSHFFSVWIMLMNQTTWGTRHDTGIPETEADTASRRNAGTAEDAVIDRWQMVSLFETQRTSTVPAAKICNASMKEKQPTMSWLSDLLSCKRSRCEYCYTWNTNGVSSYVLANWSRKKKKKHHTRVYFPLSFTCSYFNSLISTVIALPRPLPSSAGRKK